MVGSQNSHHTILYDEAGVYERIWWSNVITSHNVIVKRLGQAGLRGFMHGTGGLSGYSQLRKFFFFLPNWDSNLRPTHQRL
jgi:hypothetical protein